jgi:type IV secretion system protein VirB4
LGAIALALCASSDKVAHALIDELLRDGARPYFLEAWLHANDLAWAADLVPDLTNVQPSPSDGLAALNPNTSEVSS